MLASKSRLVAIPNGATTCQSGTRKGRSRVGIVTRSWIKAAHTVAKAINVPVENQSADQGDRKEAATNIPKQPASTTCTLRDAPPRDDLAAGHCF
jgi:hypothetical protein